MIQDPLSLKKLQKIVKGVQGRHNATGVSEFKTWAQFAERAKLLWDNAYYYNEEGSEIYELAQELEVRIRITQWRHWLRKECPANHYTLDRNTLGPS